MSAPEVRILPTSVPTFEVRIGDVTRELDVEQAEAFREEIHQAIYIATQCECAHKPCRNHPISEDGYCGRCGA